MNTHEMYIVKEVP